MIKNVLPNLEGVQWQKTLENKIAYKTDPRKFEEEVEKQGGQSIEQYVNDYKSKIIHNNYRLLKK